MNGGYNNDGGDNEVQAAAVCVNNCDCDIDGDVFDVSDEDDEDDDVDRGNDYIGGVVGEIYSNIRNNYRNLDYFNIFYSGEY